MLASGAAIQIGGIYYNLNQGTESNIAIVTSNPSNYTGQINIPSSIQYESINYTVTAIENSAFKGCTSLQSVIIPSSVTNIGEEAFYGCTSLTEVYCFIENAYEISSTVFESSSYTSATLYVPETTIDTYKNTTIWNSAQSIEAIKMYKLIYMVDGVEYKKYEHVVGATITPEPAPTKDGYVFTGWSYIPKTMPTEDVTIIGYFEKIPSDTEITISSSGSNTWCSKYDLNFKGVSGIKAYIATGYNDDDKVIMLSRVYHVPAGTGIFVKGTAGQKYTIPSAETKSCYANFLKGNLGLDIEISATDGDMTNYYLKEGSFRQVKTTAKIGQNRCYLQVPTKVFSKTRSIDCVYDDEEETTTGIQNTGVEQENDAYYNLQGQRVDNPGKGIYIKNGRKVVIRSTSR